MIYAYAIEQEVLLTWKDRASCRFIRDNFALGNPRIMAEFPHLKKWKKDFKKILNHSKLRELERSRVFELSQFLMDRVAYRKVTLYDGNDSWLQNAVSEQDKCRPFTAILATQNHNNHPSVILGSELLGLEEDERWDKEKDVDVASDAIQISAAIASLLHNCSEIKLIDPYFTLYESRYNKTLIAFLRELVRNRSEADIQKLKVQIHTSAKENRPSKEVFYGDSESKKMAKQVHQISANLKIEIFRWTEKEGGKDLHDRFIISDIGGLTFSKGLCEGKRGQSVHIAVHSRKKCEEERKAYAPDSSTFDLEDSGIIRNSKVSKQT